MTELIKCSGCGKDISEHAKACPHCGQPKWHQKVQYLTNGHMLIGFVVAFFINILLWLFGFFEYLIYPVFGYSRAEIEANRIPFYVYAACSIVTLAILNYVIIFIIKQINKARGFNPANRS